MTKVIVKCNGLNEVAGGKAVQVRFSASENGNENALWKEQKPNLTVIMTIDDPARFKDYKMFEEYELTI